MGNTQIIDGREAIKEVYLDVLSYGQVDVVCQSSEYSKVIGDWFDNVFAQKLFSSEVKTREILPDNKANRDSAKLKDQKKNQVRFIATGAASESDMLLLNDKVVLISFDQEKPMAVVVTDQEIVNGINNMFEALWKSLQ